MTALLNTWTAMRCDAKPSFDARTSSLSSPPDHKEAELTQNPPGKHRDTHADTDLNDNARINDELPSGHAEQGPGRPALSRQGQIHALHARAPQPASPAIAVPGIHQPAEANARLTAATDQTIDSRQISSPNRCARTFFSPASTVSGNSDAKSRTPQILPALDDVERDWRESAKAGSGRKHHVI